MCNFIICIHLICLHPHFFRQNRSLPEICRVLSLMSDSEAPFSKSPLLIRDHDLSSCCFLISVLKKRCIPNQIFLWQTLGLPIYSNRNGGFLCWMDLEKYITVHVTTAWAFSSFLAIARRHLIQTPLLPDLELLLERCSVAVTGTVTNAPSRQTVGKRGIGHLTRLGLYRVRSFHT